MTDVAFFDSHAHLSKEFFGAEVDSVIARAQENGVSGIVTVGSGAQPETMHEAVELAQSHEGVWATVGIHPHEADHANEESWRALESLVAKEKVVAIGEAGLDYYYDYSSRENQLKVFKRQLEIASALHKPIVIHSRQAHEDVLSLLEKSSLGVRPGVIHCFTGDLETAQRYVALGFFVSIPGVITFRKPGPLVETVRGLPVERMLVETDAPYLAPEPKRGKRNEPAFVRYTAEAIARLKGLSVADVARVTTLNAKRLFGIDVTELSPRLVYRIRDSLYVNLTNRCTLHCTFCGKFRDFVVKGYNLRLGKDPDVESIWAELLSENPLAAKEVVFCGYGEPLLRLDALKELAKRLKATGVKRVRINTDGLANLVHGKDVTRELIGLVDALSVSLNAPDSATYAKYCRSKYGEEAFKAICDFIKRAKEVIPEVVATVVALPGLDLEACRKLAGSLGVPLRVRPLDDIG